MEIELLKKNIQPHFILNTLSTLIETIESEPLEIYPFLGCSRLEEPIGRFPVSAVFHGHAHHGQPEGRTTANVPVFNVSHSLMKELSPERPFRQEADRFGETAAGGTFPLSKKEGDGPKGSGPAIDPRLRHDPHLGPELAGDALGVLGGERLGVEGGSYGGQLTNWLITQTERFAAAIPAAGIVWWTKEPGFLSRFWQLGIEMFVAGKTREDFENDLMLRLAIERQFEIIGEALTRLRNGDPTARLPLHARAPGESPLHAR